VGSLIVFYASVDMINVKVLTWHVMAKPGGK